MLMNMVSIIAVLVGTIPNVVASILRGIDPRETLDITPYATAISEFLLEQMFYIKIPRKFKMGYRQWL